MRYIHMRAVAMVVATLAACGPDAVTPPGNDGVGDDNVVAGDDDALPETATVAVSYRLLAVLGEGESVPSPTIIVDDADTGVPAPGEIEVAARRHTVSVSVPTGFVASTHTVTPVPNERLDLACSIGRDLTGRWNEKANDEIWGEEVNITMEFGSLSQTVDAAPCPTSIWMVMHPGLLPTLCLLSEDRLWVDDYYHDSIVNGVILEQGSYMEYDTVFEEMYHVTIRRIAD